MSNQMTNRDMAATLFNIATLLRDRQDNPYRIRAYENGARAILARRDQIADALREADKTLPHRKGVLGERVQRKLKELAETGRMDYVAELCADLPPHIGALMEAPGVGPRLAERLHEGLGVETAADLARAARSGRASQVWGVGPVRAAQWAQLSLFGDESGDACKDVEMFPSSITDRMPRGDASEGQERRMAA